MANSKWLDKARSVCTLYIQVYICIKNLFHYTKCGVNIFRPFSPWVLLINVYLKHCAYQIKIFTLTFRLQSISYIFLGIARSIYEKNMLSHSTFKYHILHLMIILYIYILSKYQMIHLVSLSFCL